MTLTSIPIDMCTPAPYNPRVELRPGDPVFEQLKRSVETFGPVEPIVWNRRTGHVVGGHQRLGVLRHLGWERVEVVEVDLDEVKEKALNLALNKISGAWDEPKLAQLLGELGGVPDLDLALTGFGSEEITELLARVEAANAPLGDDEGFDPGAALDESGPAVTRPGELLVLGRHRLLCGDCTDPEHVRRVMDGDRAVLFATDPPYLVGYDGTNHPGGKVGGNAKKGAPDSRASKNRASRNKDWSGSYGVTWDDADANSDLYDRFIGVAVAHALAPDAAWYCWHASRRQAMVEAAWNKHGAFVHCQIVWAKNRPVLTRTWYAWQHEPCFFGWVQGKKPARAEDAVRSTLWSIDTLPNGPERPDHPTPKPLEVFEIPMRQHTRAGETCYEPFAGSGTQLIAAERLGRRCCALEISPRYCDVIVRRWIHLVGAARAGRALVERYALPAAKASAARTPAAKTSAASGEAVRA
jgi:DNA modification methylase